MKKKIFYFNATSLYGRSMSQMLPHDELEMWHGHPDLYMKKLEEILISPVEADIGYFVDIDLRYPDNIKERTKKFPFYPEYKGIPEDKSNDYIKQRKPKNYTNRKKLISDWTDKKKYLIHQKMLKLYVRHGMVVEQIHEIISFKPNRWLEKYISFEKQKRNTTKKEFEKDFYKLLNNAALGKMMDNFHNLLKIQFIKKYDFEKNIEQQSKLTFKGILKSYETCDCYTFKQNEVLMDKPIYVGFAILEMSKLGMYET